MAEKVVERKVRLDKGRLVDVAHAKRAEANGGPRIKAAALKENTGKYYVPETKEVVLAN